MFAFALMALLILLALSNFAILADSVLRWRSAYGALNRQLAGGDRVFAHEPSGNRLRNVDHPRPLGSRIAMQRVALRAAA